MEKQLKKFRDLNAKALITLLSMPMRDPDRAEMLARKKALQTQIRLMELVLNKRISKGYDC